MDKKQICNEIQGFVRKEAGNSLPDGRPIFDEPLVGFAAADDPLFDVYKTVIGNFHRKPREILADARTVIVWVLPISAVVRETNRREKELPSLSWAWTRGQGEEFNESLRRHVVSILQEHGFTAEAPQLQESWQVVEDPATGIASTWSERHAAYAAGLGTFGLSDSLITSRGSAHRVGSVITSLFISPSPRPYGAPREYCLHFRGVKCGGCIRRCPVGAITAEGHDKIKCREHVYGPLTKALAEVCGFAKAGCGLCQTGVPCEAEVPESPPKLFQPHMTTP